MPTHFPLSKYHFLTGKIMVLVAQCRGMLVKISSLQRCWPYSDSGPLQGILGLLLPGWGLAGKLGDRDKVWESRLGQSKAFPLCVLTNPSQSGGHLKQVLLPRVTSSSASKLTSVSVPCRGSKAIPPSLRSVLASFLDQLTDLWWLWVCSVAGSSSAGKERSIQKSLQSPTISLCLHLVTDPFLHQSSLQEEFNAKFILLEVKPYSEDEVTAWEVKVPRRKLR